MTLPLERDVLIAFLIAAKRHTYAGQEEEANVEPVWPGSCQLEYQDGPLLYRDVFFGSAYFVGQETVYYDSSPLWSMCYSGGIFADASATIDAGQVYKFLQAALRQVSAERPYRGPDEFRRGAFTYTDRSEGDVEGFWGVEAITFEGRKIYELHYGGGLVS